MRGYRFRVLALCGTLIFLGFCGCAMDEESVLLIGTDEETGRTNVETSVDSCVASDSDSTGKDTSQEANGNLIYVHVCGAVKAPGLVILHEGSRVADALAAAGGLAEDGDESAVNLADWVQDGQQVYVPTFDEAVSLAAAEAVKESGLVNINLADAATLTTLPGIGESRAQDIIAYREKNGAFANTEDIMLVSGIKTSLYEKICDKITVK